MSVAFLDARARHILRQRLIEADEARMGKKACDLRRTKQKRRSAKSLRNGPAIDAVLGKQKHLCDSRDLATSK